MGSVLSTPRSQVIKLRGYKIEKPRKALACDSGSQVSAVATVRLRLFRGEEHGCFPWWVGLSLKCDRFGYLESTNVIIPHSRGSVEPKHKKKVATTPPQRGESLAEARDTNPPHATEDKGG